MRAGVESFIIRRLLIRRMAGLEADLALKEFSPGVNIIYGPNGVGKSRTALALNLALWPNAIAGASRDAVSAEFEIGSEPWAIEVDAGDVRRHRRGIDADAPVLPGYEVRDRYNLALQDLLMDKGEDFARAIGRESAGGYDLSAAVRSLEINHKPTPKTGEKTRALQSAMQRVQDRRGELERIRQRGEELSEKKQDLEAAAAAASRAPRLAAARELTEARARHRQLESRLAEFAPAIARLTGRELDQLRQLRNDVESETRATEAAERDRAAAKQSLADARLPDGTHDETIVQTLAELSRQIGDLRSEIGIAERGVEEARARRSAARDAIDPGIEEAKLARIDVKGINMLAAFSRKAEIARADLAASQALQRWLAPRETDGQRDVAALEEGLRLLSQWLRQPAPAMVQKPVSASRWIMLAAGLMIVLIAGLLAWKWTAWAGLLGISGPVLFYMSRHTSALIAPVPDGRPFFQQQYQALGLEPPADWSAESVEVRHRALWDQLASSKIDRERSDRLADLRPQVDAAAQRVIEIGQERQELFAQIGIVPNLSEPVLHVLIEAVVRWQAADGALAAADASLKCARERQAALLASAAECATPFGYSIAAATELPGVADALGKRFAQRATALQRLAQARQRLDESARRERELSARIALLFADLGLTPDDEPTLRQWILSREEFGRARSALDISAAQIRDHQARVGDASELLALPPEELDALCADALAQAEREKSLLTEIAGIESEIEQARRRTDLEAAQADRREAAAALAGARDEDCEAAAGWALAEYLRTASRERHQSAVFRGARELFARVTRGRYRLEVDDGGEIPQFRSIDSNTGFGQSLDELSSGTRLQLLLCVRVAFVEQQEQGPKLPLILDETLANSDETRARQILDAIMEICRAGRQIFYFTAQPDEVGKWREVLEASSAPPPHQFIDLAAVRGLAAAERMPARQIITTPAPRIPEPAGMTREQYRQALEAPGIDTYAETAGGAHLWHLVDDLAILHQLLSMGIKTWGQWKEMTEYGGLENATAAQAYSVAAARAGAIETMARLWRIGRGKRVDRQVLLDSDAVSKKFIEPVIALAAELKGDSRQLIAQLEEGKISGFRSATLEKLRQYLQDGGYLDPRDPLPADELRTRTMGIVSREIAAGGLSVALIDEYLATWFGETAAAAHAD